MLLQPQVNLKIADCDKTKLAENILNEFKDGIRVGSNAALLPDKMKYKFQKLEVVNRDKIAPFQHLKICNSFVPININSCTINV